MAVNRISGSAPLPGASISAYVVPARPSPTRAAPGDVEPPVRHRVAGLGDVAAGHHHHEDAEREVDQEDRPPRHRIDQIAAQQRPDRGRHAAQARPGADRACTITGPEARLDHREAAGRQQRSADALQQPREDQHLGVRCDRAQQRGGGEHADPDHEDAAAPEAVAQRPAEQDQRRERQQVAVEHPLQVAGGRVEVTTDVGQRDVDHGAVEEGEAGPQDGDGQHPVTGGTVVGDLLGGVLHGYRVRAGLRVRVLVRVLMEDLPCFLLGQRSLIVPRLRGNRG